MIKEDIFRRFYTARGDLTKNSQKIAEFIVDNPQEAQHMSITNLADACEISEASVSRFCKQMGYAGFSELKIALARALAKKKVPLVQKQLRVSIRSCLEFLENYCLNQDAQGRMYFTVTEEGKPLRQRRYKFSEGFYCIGNAEFYGVTGEEKYLERARWAYEVIYNLDQGEEDPTGFGPKTIPETRKSRGLGDPMIYLNTTQIMRRVDPEHEALYSARAQECVRKILDLHHKPELKATLETVAPDGSLQTETTAGRVVNPGHSIECAWFLMEEAKYLGDEDLRKKAEEIFQFAIARGWDEEYQGILYFVDVMGYPPESYEHDMKLWWPHNEALIASLMLYRDTGKEEYKIWFERILEYSKAYFSDPEYGEWFGYLRRDGQPTWPAAKGSTFKGPFHLPRCLIYVDKILEELA